MKRKRRKPETLTANSRGYVRVLLLLVVSLFLSVQAKAQCQAINTAFSPGEQLTFNLYYNWKFIWIKAGTATLDIAGVQYNGEPAYQMSLLSVTSKRVDLFFRMRDTITSIFTESIEPLYYRKGAVEGKRYTVDEAWFNYENGETIVKQKRLYQNGQMLETTSQDTLCVYDMLSALASARSFETAGMTEGQSIIIPIVTGKKIVNETLIYNGMKDTKADNGHTYRCQVFTFSEINNQTGQNEPVLRFYITDDQNHLPVRLDMYLNIGSAKAYLSAMEGVKYPLTSQVD